MGKKLLYNNFFIKLVIMIFTVCGLYLLCSQFPYSGDDWAWGCDIGIERLKGWFEGYNGRYLGNLLVLALTRSVILRNIVMSAVLFGIMYLSYRIVNKNRLYIFLLVVALFITIPRYVFRQSIVWTAGFSNYVPSIMFSLIFILTVKNIFEEEKPSYKNALIPLMFFIGLAGGLFVEHITIYNVGVAVIVILFAFIKYKKIFFTHVSFLIGTLVSAVIMFSNSSYGIISSNNDEYRTMALSIGKIARQAYENSKVIYKEMVFNNILLNVFLCIAVVSLGLTFLKKNNSSRLNKAFLYCALILNIAYVVYTILLTVYPYWCITLDVPGVMPKFNIAFTAMYLITLAIIPILCIRDVNRLAKLLLPLISVAIMAVPLLIVTPIGSRCFFPTYVMFTVFGAEIINYVMPEGKNASKSIVCVVISSIILIGGIYYGCIYHTIHKYDVKRIDYMNEQIEDGNKIIKMSILPYPDYVWAGTPENDTEIWAVRMKKFYGVDENTEFEYISFNELDRLTK